MKFKTHKYYMTARPIDHRKPRTAIWSYHDKEGWKLIKSRNKIYRKDSAHPEFNKWSKHFEFNIILPEDIFIELL